MVFKLVRIDTSPAPLKIDLNLGKHLIGRGKFLHNDDSDKRVSRNHAELEVTESSIALKSLHKNPCFYIKRHTIETQLLQQDCEVTLSNGDKFGLIPDNFWYEVLEIIDQNSEQNGCNIDSGITNEPNEDNKAKEEEMGSHDDKEPFNVEIKQEVAELDRTTSPSLLNQQSAQENSVEPAVPAEDMISPMKRSLSTDCLGAVIVKKVKAEPDEAEDVKPGLSTDHVGSSNGNNDRDGPPKRDAADGPDIPQKPNNGPLRERCMYGANCYRRNPQHKAQFSHPADSDWGAGPRGVCPWGAACRRRQPQHWRDHQHPPGASPPHPGAARPPGKKRKPKTDYDSDEESPTSPVDQIVTGKRVRKPVNSATWSGSDVEDADPYGTDESDEWQPPSNLTNSQDYTEEL